MPDGDIWFDEELRLLETQAPTSPDWKSEGVQLDDEDVIHYIIHIGEHGYYLEREPFV